MSNREPIEFNDPSPAEVSVKIGDKEYVLREASGEAAICYRNVRANCTRFVDGKFAGIEGPIAEADLKLVARCLFHVWEDRGEKKFSLVEEKLIRSWPHRVLETLAKRVKDISPSLEEADQETLKDLEERLAKLKAARDSSKNSPEGTTDGSS